MGGWYQDENGVTKTGSASHPVIARQSRLQQWAREINEPVYQLGITTFVNTMILSTGNQMMETFQVLNVAVRNTGTVTSYVESVGFVLDFDGVTEIVSLVNSFTDVVLNQLSAQLHTPLAPGSKQTFQYNLAKATRSLSDYPAWHRNQRITDRMKFALLEVVVTDELGTTYRETVAEETRDAVRRAFIKGLGETTGQ